MRLVHSLTFATLALILLAAAPARASHYPLTEVPTLITAADAEKLGKVEISTTEDLISKAGNRKERVAAAKAAGLKPAALWAMVRRADLLRIKGVGPEMVLLLEAAGVKDLGDLKKKDAAKLDAAMTKANEAAKKKGQALTEKPPAPEQIAFWIDEAKKADVLIHK